MQGVEGALVMGSIARQYGDCKGAKSVDGSGGLSEGLPNDRFHGLLPRDQHGIDPPLR